MALADGLPVGIEAIPLDLEAPKLQAYITGIDENWSAIFAETKEEAARLFADNNFYEWCAEDRDTHCGDDNCDDCSIRTSVEAHRHPPFDQYEKVEHVPMRAWHQAGFSVPCANCEETYPGYDSDFYPNREDIAEIDGRMLCVECQPIEHAMVAAFGPRIS